MCDMSLMEGDNFSSGRKCKVFRRQEVENGYVVVVSTPCEELCHNVQAVSEYAFGLPSVLQDSDGFEVMIDELPDVVAPNESHHYQQQQFFNPFYVCKMRVFDIEPRALHDPPLADKLTVGEKAVDGLPSEEVDVPLHEVDALLRVGRMFGEKALYSPQTRVGFGGRVETS